MTREERLADLQRQREEINRLIREERKAGEVSAPGAKIVRRRAYGRGPEEWTVALEVKQRSHYRDVMRFLTVYRGDTKRECIDAIPGIIGTLRGLYDAATKGGEE